MAFEGVAAVTARIAEIQQRLGALSAPPFAPRVATSFDQVLLRTEQALAGGHAGPHGVRVPAGLEGYENGRIPDRVLVPIGAGNHRLWAPAAAAFGRMRAAAAASGVRLDFTDSYRTYAAQVDVARRKGLYEEGGLAARPGTSTHGWGLSLDVVTTDEALSWLRANGAQFGFVEDVDREPWHWTYEGGAASGPTMPDRPPGLIPVTPA